LRRGAVESRGAIGVTVFLSGADRVGRAVDVWDFRTMKLDKGGGAAARVDSFWAKEGVIFTTNTEVGKNFEARAAAEGILTRP